MYFSLMDKGQKNTFSNRNAKMMHGIYLPRQGWEVGGYRACGGKVDFLYTLLDKAAERVLLPSPQLWL